MARVAGLFRDHWPTSAALWMPEGRPPVAGEVVRLPAYAATLRRLVESGADAPDRRSRIDAARRAWGEGFVAEAVDAFVRTPHRHSDGADHAGVLTSDDMAGWRAGYEGPATLDVHGVTVCKTGPWGQGPVLLQALAILAGFEPHEAWTRRPQPGRTGSSRRSSSRSPTGTPTTATPTPTAVRPCRWRPCSPRTTPPSGGP